MFPTSSMSTSTSISRFRGRRASGVPVARTSGVREARTSGVPHQDPDRPRRESVGAAVGEAAGARDTGTGDFALGLEQEALGCDPVLVGEQPVVELE